MEPRKDKCKEGEQSKDKKARELPKEPLFDTLQTNSSNSWQVQQEVTAHIRWPSTGQLATGCQHWKVGHLIWSSTQGHQHHRHGNWDYFMSALRRLRIFTLKNFMGQMGSCISPVSTAEEMGEKRGVHVSVWKNYVWAGILILLTLGFVGQPVLAEFGSFNMP